jgi:methyltransferase (TIGR00027 family)
VDFARDDLSAALAAAGHRADVPTTWVWEGVVTYLTRPEVEATAAVVGERSAPGSRLVVNYQAPSRTAALGLVAARALAAVGRRPSPLSGEPRRSWWAPDEMAAVLAAQGFEVVSDDDLLTLARRLGAPAAHPRSLRPGRVTTADRARPPLTPPRR